MELLFVVLLGVACLIRNPLLALFFLGCLVFSILGSIERFV